MFLSPLPISHSPKVRGTAEEPCHRGGLIQGQVLHSKNQGRNAVYSPVSQQTVKSLFIWKISILCQQQTFPLANSPCCNICFILNFNLCFISVILLCNQPEHLPFFRYIILLWLFFIMSQYETISCLDLKGQLLISFHCSVYLEMLFSEWLLFCLFFHQIPHI